MNSTSRLNLAVIKFNNREFFDCHEILEDIWFDKRDSSRDFYRGLLHIAVGFYHLTVKKNAGGAEAQLSKAIKRLSVYKKDYKGIELGKLMAQTGRILTGLQKQVIPVRLPKIHFIKH